MSLVRVADPCDNSRMASSENFDERGYSDRGYPIDLMGFLDSGYFDGPWTGACLPECLQWEFTRTFPASGPNGDPRDFRESAMSADGGMPWISNRKAINETELLAGMAQAVRMAFYWAKNGIVEGRYERGFSREREFPHAFLVNPLDKMRLQIFVAEANNAFVFDPDLQNACQTFEGCLLAATDLVPEGRFALLDEGDYKKLLASSR